LQLYCSGIAAPGAKAELVKVKAIEAPLPAGAACCANVVPRLTASRAAIFTIGFIRNHLSYCAVPNSEINAPWYYFGLRLTGKVVPQIPDF
jgi:hypothetical protein